MATKFAEAQIRGRIGSYDFALYDRQEEYTSVSQLELLEPIVIEWGQQGREYPKQILKSRSRIQVVGKEARRLDKILSGGFDRSRFLGVIEGRGVEWSGWVQPESKDLPINPQIQKPSTTILLADDFNKAKNALPDPNSGQIASPQELLFRLFPGSDVVAQWPGFYEDLDGSDYELSTDNVAVEWRPLDDAYEALVAFARFTRSRIYRPLSRRRTVLHELRSTGQDIIARRRSPGATSSQSTSLDGRVVEPDNRDIILPDQERPFREVEQVGLISADLGTDYNLAHEGTWEIIDGPGIISNVFDQRDYADLAFTGLSGGGEVEFEAVLGEFSPANGRKLGVLVDWEITSASITSLSVEVRDGNGASNSVNGKDENSVQVGATSNTITPQITIIGESGAVDIRARLIDGAGRVVETLYAESSQDGIEPIEIGAERMPTVPHPTRTRERFAASRYVASDLGIDAVQPFIALFTTERAYRPFGIQSFQAEVLGLYGPEDMLIIPVPGIENDRRAPFVCGKGRKVNLTAGKTTVSDVEIPSEILPTDVL